MRAIYAWMAWTPANGVYSDDPTEGMLQIGPKDTRESWQNDPRYRYTLGFDTLRSITSSDQMRTVVLAEFNTLIVRDKLDPELVHREFLKVDEYRWCLSWDIKGAEEAPNNPDAGMPWARKKRAS